MQQGRGRKVLKRKRKAVPVRSRQIKKRRTSTAKFRTSFDWIWLQNIRSLFQVKTRAYRCSKYPSLMFLLWKVNGLNTNPFQSGTNPIEFVIKSLSDYIDINKTELRLVIKITKNNGKNIAPENKYTLINNAFSRQASPSSWMKHSSQSSPTHKPTIHTSRPCLILLNRPRNLIWPRPCTTKSLQDTWMKWIILQKITGDSWREVIQYNTMY